ncbi:hypothetical protein GQ457_10G027670 [Hibiscus cannabinus]
MLMIDRTYVLDRVERRERERTKLSSDLDNRVYSDESFPRFALALIASLYSSHLFYSDSKIIFDTFFFLPILVGESSNFNRLADNRDFSVPFVQILTSGFFGGFLLKDGFFDVV